MSSSRGAVRNVAVSMFYLPEDEFARAVESWPKPRDQYGRHARHRWEVEHRLRELDGEYSVLITVATAAGLAEYGARVNEDPALGSTRSAFAAG
ncbi:hypothetical protein [Nocardia sp. NPDC059239]|uniref:hypothetical protein n=1 Tax=unclassified Nocardia TaxID=2637762 RepID=UPI0036C6C3B6